MWIIAWVLIFILASFISVFTKKHLRISSATSLVIGLALSPILLAEFLFLLYRFFPKYPHDFYKIIFMLTVSSLLLLLSRFKTEIKWPTPPKLNLSSYFYLASIISITAVTFIRMIFWPITWYDQTEYYAVSHTHYFQREARNEVVNPLREHDGLVSGIRPGIPLMINYFAIFNNNNILVEKELMFLVFYYFMLTLIIFNLLARNTFRDINVALCGLFLITTCFFFINFTIFGFKEIMLVALGLVACAIFKETQANKRFIFFAPLLGLVLGTMAFIHFTGVVLGVLLFVSYVINSKIKIFGKIVFILLTFLTMYLSSLGEIRFFAGWATQGLHSLPAISSVSDDLAKGGAGELKLVGQMTKTDTLLKGKLQALTQVQSFGFVFWIVLLGVVLNIKQILSDNHKRFVFMVVGGFMLLIFNPFSLFGHEASYVFLVSPKYYLLLLPFLLLIVLNIFPHISRLFQKIPRRFVFFATIFTSVAALVPTLFREKTLQAISLFVPLHYNNTSYYLTKLTEFCLLYAGLSLILLLFASNKRKYSKKLTEVLFFGYFFLVPFAFFFNNNYGLLETLTLSLSSRSEKVGVSNKAKVDLYETFAVLLKNHHKGEIVLLLDPGDGPQFNYYLLTKYDEYFNNPKITNYVYSSEPLEMKYEWIIKNSENNLTELFNEKYTVFFENKYSQLLRII